MTYKCPHMYALHVAVGCETCVFLSQNRRATTMMAMTTITRMTDTATTALFVPPPLFDGAAVGVACVSHRSPDQPVPCKMRSFIPSKIMLSWNHTRTVAALANGAGRWSHAPTVSVARTQGGVCQLCWDNNWKISTLSLNNQSINFRAALNQIYTSRTVTVVIYRITWTSTLITVSGNGEAHQEAVVASTEG